MARSIGVRKCNFTSPAPATTTTTTTTATSNTCATAFSAFVLLSVVAIGAPFTDAAVIQAVIEIDGSPEDFIKIIMGKMERPIDYARDPGDEVAVHENGGERESRHSHDVGPSTSMRVGAAASGRPGRRFDIRGNISESGSSIEFRLYVEATDGTASRRRPAIRVAPDTLEEEEDDEAETCSSDVEDRGRRSNGGVLSPIVKTVEPYAIALVDIIFHGIMTTVVSKLMENARMTGDLRIA